ncbi:MAG TPA: tRNA (uridine(54)-C5)-methyltransferase TrmA [Succinivibrionaceae bacterium]|nr:tRNA (uridine(54)-C5)-methyltransferase TrmA [Succinivibrionaceae bacterium]
MLEPLLYTVDPENYPLYLKEKVEKALNLFKKCGIAHPAAEIHASAPSNFRSRCEFGIFKEGDSFSYAMYKGKGNNRERILLKEFPMATVATNHVMKLLLEVLPHNEELYRRLFSIEFLTSRTQESVISLNYHRKLDEDLWKEAALKLKENLKDSGITCNFVGRARKQMVVASADHITESLLTDDGHEFKLKEVIGTFSQPNAQVAGHMVSFARSCCSDTKDRDLIELYCGSGTFTVCLADLFRKAFATEVARIPTQTAFENLKLNNLSNVKLARLSADEVAEALSGVREFFRLKEAKVTLSDYDFSTLLIDPPRCGLCDEKALEFTSRFDKVIYISCNPETLCSDLGYLTKTHRVSRLAFFDQFPYTPHLESGVLLEKI